MVIKLSEKLAFHLYKKGYIEEDEIEIFRYGYSIIIDGIVDCMIMIMAGVLTHRLLNVFVFILVFCMLRQFTGGYHEISRFRCIIMSLSVCLLCIFSPTLIPEKASYLFIYLSTIFSTLIIIWKAPVENSKKKLDASLIKKNKKSAVIVSIIFMVMAVIVGIVFTEAATVIAATMLMVSLLIVAAILSNL